MYNKEDIIKLLDNNGGIKIKKYPAPCGADDKVFQEIINGLFQAEGNIYYEFFEKNSEQGQFKWSISLNGSEGSIKLLKDLNEVFDNKLYKNIFTNNEKIHVRMYTKDILLIINKIKPYLYNIYGEKYRCFVFLIKIKYILDILKKIDYKDNKDKYIDLIIKLICLVYNMIENNQSLRPPFKGGRIINLDEKLKLVLSKYNEKDYYNDKYIKEINYYKDYIKKIKDNKNDKFNINFKWLLGFILGNGNVTYFIEGKYPKIKYVYMLRLVQKITEDNKKLFNLIVLFLNEKKISINFHKGREDMVEIRISSVNSLLNLFNEWIIYKEYWYNKRLDFYYCYKTLLLSKISRYWYYGALLRILLLKEYKNLKYKNWSKKSLKLKKYSIDEIVEDLKKILINMNIKVFEVGAVEENLINKNYIEKVLIKDNTDTNLFLYPNYYSDNIKLLLLTRIYEKKILKVPAQTTCGAEEEDLLFIRKYKELGYVVKLPINITPKEKYFYYSTWGKDKALLESKNYRNNQLSNWLYKYIFNNTN